MIVIVVDGPRRRVRRRLWRRVAGTLGGSLDGRCGNRSAGRLLSESGPLPRRSRIVGRPAVQGRRVRRLAISKALPTRENDRVRVGELCDQSGQGLLAMIRSRPWPHLLVMIVVHGPHPVVHVHRGRAHGKRRRRERRSVREREGGEGEHRIGRGTNGVVKTQDQEDANDGFVAKRGQSRACSASLRENLILSYRFPNTNNSRHYQVT